MKQLSNNVFDDEENLPRMESVYNKNCEGTLCAEIDEKKAPKETKYAEKL